MTTANTDKPTKRGRGQPPFKFDYVQLEEVCRLNPTDDEIALVFGCSRKTVTNHKNEPKFVEARARGEAQAKQTLRRLQWQSAQGEEPQVLTDKFNQPIVLMGKNGQQTVAMKPGREPSVTMQIWLGKNLLGQTDKQEITGANGNEMVIKVVYEAPCQSAP